MPNISLTTTAVDVFAGDVYLRSVAFRNGSATGTVYLRNKRNNLAEVSSSSYDFSLGAGDAVGFDWVNDGDFIRGPWRAVGSATVTLEVLPGYHRDRRD